MRDTDRQSTLQAIRRLAERMMETPSDADTENSVRRLAEEKGEWVFDSIVDHLTKGAEGTYPQALQDRFRRRADDHLVVANCSTRLPIVSLEALQQSCHSLLQGDVSTQPMFTMLSELTSADFYSIPREAHLTRVEREVWEYYLKGKTCDEIAQYVCKDDGSLYRVNSIRKILHRVQEKVWNCKAIGWRTAMEEDIHRGKHGHYPPARISWVEVASR